jgi:hypothetical protein
MLYSVSTLHCMICPRYDVPLLTPRIGLARADPAVVRRVRVRKASLRPIPYVLAFTMKPGGAKSRRGEAGEGARSPRCSSA